MQSIEIITKLYSYKNNQNIYNPNKAGIKLLNVHPEVNS